MFRKLFGKRGSNQQERKEGKGRSEAVATLQLLDKAIMSVHPEQFGDSHDAAPYLQGSRVNINTFLGRAGTERFFPIDYEAVVQRLDHYASRNILGQMLQLSKSLLTVDALLQGALLEYKIRRHKDQHDAINLGKEVQKSTLTLIDFLNRGASTRPEPMPPR